MRKGRTSRSVMVGSIPWIALLYSRLRYWFCTLLKHPSECRGVVHGLYPTLGRSPMSQTCTDLRQQPSLDNTYKGRSEGAPQTGRAEN
jgi:hypothetical protein